MKADIARFGAEYRLQLRLMVGHWSYWVMHLVFAALMIALFGTRVDRSAEGMLTASMGTVAAGLILLVCVLLSGMASSRATQSRFLELTESYPCGGETLLAGWLASLTAGLGLILEPLALAAYIGPLPSLLAGLFPFCSYVLVGAMLGSAFTWWLAGWMKFQRWIYPLLAAAWAAFWLGPMFLTRAGVDLTLLDIPTRMQNADYDALFGRLEPPALVTWFCLFLAGLGLVLIALAQGRRHARRFNRPFNLGFAAALLIAALSMVCGVQFARAKSTLEQTAAQNPGFHPVAELSDPGRIEAYDAQVDMTATGQPTITVKLTLRNLAPSPKDSFKFALNPAFQIVSSSVPATHDQDTLQVQLPEPLSPQGTTQITLTYQGTLITYSNGIQIPVVAQFINRQQARLGLYSFWLPIAGDENLGKLAELGTLTEPVAVRLAVKTLPGVHAYSNLTQVAPGQYASSSTDWVYFLASPRLESKTVENIQVVGPTDDLELAARHSGEIEGYYHMLQTFFPQVKAGPINLLMVDTREGLSIKDIEVLDQRPFLVIPRIFFAYWDQDTSSKAQTTMAIGSALVNDFYQLSGGSTLEGQDLDVLGRFLWVYYECKGDPALLRQSIGYAQPLKDVLLQVVTESGQEGLIQAVETLRSAPADPENDDTVANWLKASLNVH